MNRNQAYALVQQTFTQAFDKNRFSNFSRNVLNHVDESKAFTRNSQYIKAAFKDHIQRFERLGTYTSPEREKLDVLIVHLTKESKLERARTAIRNFVADHLKTRDEKDAALVAFVSPAETTWRFSYVKMEYATVEKDSGKVGVETRLTPARRFSYIVGEGESCHTAQTRFLGLLQGTEADPALADIEEAFSVEAVTKEFFTKYVELFGEIHKALEKLVAKDKTFRDEFTAKGVNPVDFAKKLMGQIVFLYFLQKKGWLGVAKGEDWGSGPRDFLRRLANGEYGEYPNFFNDVLEPLFYHELATDRGHEAWSDLFQCRIPFLNGGLFEPLGEYDWGTTDIVLPDKLFTNSEFVDEGIRGTGVLDVFDRYNFTVNEAEPLEKEVAIDPEMLGKVFENLIEENRRKGLGAYYTPREIVHYMCEESLINYLDTSLNTHQESLVSPKPKQAKLFGKPEPGQTPLQTVVHEEVVPRADIETFVHLGEQISHYEAVETKYRIKMPKSIELHARLIDEKLAEITICDPAVGSGAFPVGMMTEIVRARSAITPYFNDVHERTPYHFKRHAIQNCIYGVDIDPSAVEIAKLRLWLSLVVDEEDVKQIKPLPNLDYKIVPGNSLLGFPFKSQRVGEIEKLKRRFFDETDHAIKAELKTQVDRLLAECFAASRKSLGYEVNFDFEIYFSEVFNRRGGFDVVTANPPYVRPHKISPEMKAILWQYYRPVFEAKSDLYACFIQKSIELLRVQGVMSFIVSKTWLSLESFEALRRYILRNTSVRLLSIPPEKTFESATVETIVVLFERQLLESEREGNEVKVSRFDGRQFVFERLIPQKLFEDTHLHAFDLSLNDFTLDLNRKMQRQTNPLEKCVRFFYGMKTGDDSKFIHAKQLTSQHRKLLRRSDFGKYVTSWRGEYVWYNPDEMRQHRQTARPGDPQRFESAKILVQDIGKRIVATLDEEKYYVKDALLLLGNPTGPDLKYVLGILNSRLIGYYYSKTFANLSVAKNAILTLPIRVINSSDLKEKEKGKHISTLVDRILTAKQRDPKANTPALEREIDQLVYDLYDLSPEEISVVEESTTAK